MYKIDVDLIPERLTLKMLGDGELAIVTEGEFMGELFYKNVIGLHSISNNRYWPSDWAKASSKTRDGAWTGPLDLACRRIVAGDILRVRE